MEAVKYIAAIICGTYVTILLLNSMGDAVKDFFDNILGLIVFLLSAWGISSLFNNLFDYILKSIKGGVETVKEHNENKRQIEEYLSEMRRSERQYISAKNSYKYFSDDKIREQLELSESNFNPVERLALEETAVERGIIDHSPIHEKGSSLLRAINKTANDL